MTQLQNAFTLFLSLLVEAMPFLLLGVLFSSALLFFVDERRLLALLPKSAFWGALAGSIVGFLFPVCECGNVPVARRLLIQGAPTSVAIGFLLAAPTVNPIVFWSTWTAFRGQPEMVFLRVGLSLAIATIIGWVFSAQTDLRPLLQPNVRDRVAVTQLRHPEMAATSPLLQSGTYLLGGSGGTAVRWEQAAIESSLPIPASTLGTATRWRLFIDNTVQELRELGAMLVLGSVIAALIQVFVPRDWILALGQGPVMSILAMMLLAAVVSICSTVDAFFALSFASLFTTGSLLAFLVFGPMIDLKAIGLMLTVFKPRAIFYLFTLAGQLVFLACLFINFYIS
ncbi:permease [Trichothermofontia sichuanensis B231]|uniref:permease n=1 Tax=Trichothermofontia sichuanensis TaxID=3045816 RepID=UPI002245538C|nr:permease [Trichothermofontia sichuanensis]UZQ55944.1 permease [Trichothermofontia sichuanensis B231]